MTPWLSVIEDIVATKIIFILVIFSISFLFEKEFAISYVGPSVSLNPGQSPIWIYFPFSVFLFISLGIFVHEPYASAIPCPYTLISPVN